MSKVKGPLLSISASGKIADSIVFGKWKGVKYARAYMAPPYNPQSSAQTAQRTKFSAAVALWQGKDASVKSDWNARAQALGYNMSGFNFFVQQYIAQGADPTLP